MERDNKTTTVEGWNHIRELAKMSIGTDKGRWWADPNFGSEIYLLKETGKVDGKTAGTFKRMLQECLAWLVTDGLAKKISCAADRTGRNEISYTVEITRPDGNKSYIKDVWNGV
jgi:phage gp46-like protein